MESAANTNARTQAQTLNMPNDGSRRFPFRTPICVAKMIPATARVQVHSGARRTARPSPIATHKRMTISSIMPQSPITRLTLCADTTAQALSHARGLAKKEFSRSRLRQHPVSGVAAGLDGAGETAETRKRRGQIEPWNCGLHRAVDALPDRPLWRQRGESVDCSFRGAKIAVHRVRGVEHRRHDVARKAGKLPVDRGRDGVAPLVALGVVGLL